MTINLGSNEAKVGDWGFTVNKNDRTVQVAVEFLIQPEEDRVNWYGSLKTDKSKAFVLDVLKACGYPHDDFVPEFAEGLETGLLDTDKLVRVEVAQEVSKAGNPYYKITWVGERKQKFFDQIDSAEASKLLGKPLKAKNENTSNVKIASTSSPRDPLDLDDIGF